MRHPLNNGNQLKLYTNHRHAAMEAIMNAEQRVLSAFQRKKRDCVPINYLYNEGIQRQLMDHFRVYDAEGVLRRQ